MYSRTLLSPLLCSCFFYTDTATTEIYTLSLHDALPILFARGPLASPRPAFECDGRAPRGRTRATRRARAPHRRDRKSTRLNSSHRCISYAVFCLKKKRKRQLRLFAGSSYAFHMRCHGLE